jgi:hypothetical protein
MTTTPYFETVTQPNGIKRLAPAPRVRHAAEGNRHTRTRTFECAVCHAVVTVRGLGASNERRYCNAVCRERAWIALRAERRRAGRQTERCCEACRSPIPPPGPGLAYQPTQRFCSARCRERVASRRWRAAHAQ